MAKILTTKGSAAALEDILLKAKKEVILISYSYKISESFLSILKRVTGNKITVQLVHGTPLKSETRKQLAGIENLEIFHLPNLHAKIFANETKCIIGSMNFSEASEINNTELSVWLTLATDGATFEDAKEHCTSILKQAKSSGSNSPKQTSSKNSQNKEKENPAENQPKWMVTKNGVTEEYKYDTSAPTLFCIRCCCTIPANPFKPLCAECFLTWNVWARVDYRENYCNKCGKEDNEISYQFPLCDDCYSKNQF